MKNSHDLDRRLKENNIKYSLVSVIHLKELQEEFNELNKTGKINNSVHEKYYLNRFQFALSEETRNAQSIFNNYTQTGMKKCSIVFQCFVMLLVIGCSTSRYAKLLEAFKTVTNDYKISLDYFIKLSVILIPNMSNTSVIFTPG